MKTKKTSKALAKLAGKYLEMKLGDFYSHLCNRSLISIHRDIKRLAASVLSQYESEQAEKPKKKQVKK